MRGPERRAEAWVGRTGAKGRGNKTPPAPREELARPSSHRDVVTGTAASLPEEASADCVLDADQRLLRLDGPRFGGSRTPFGLRQLLLSGRDARCGSLQRLFRLVSARVCRAPLGFQRLDSRVRTLQLLDGVLGKAPRAVLDASDDLGGAMDKVQGFLAPVFR